jgi:hypothetical protein
VIKTMGKHQDQIHSAMAQKAAEDGGEAGE